jgi:hypothetical protein
MGYTETWMKGLQGYLTLHLFLPFIYCIINLTTIFGYRKEKYRFLLDINGTFQKVYVPFTRIKIELVKLDISDSFSLSLIYIAKGIYRNGDEFELNEASDLVPNKKSQGKGCVSAFEAGVVHGGNIWLRGMPPQTIPDIRTRRLSRIIEDLKTVLMIKG